MSGILRVHFIRTGGREGGAQAAYWGTREAFVAFIIGNAPMIYGGGRIWIRNLKEPKAYSRVKSRMKSLPGVDRFNAVISRIGLSCNRTVPEKPLQAKKFAMLNVTDTANSSSQLSGISSTLWGPTQSHTRTDTAALDRRNSSRWVNDPIIGLRVTRDFQVDIESVKSRDNDLETIGTGSGQHSRTDSEARLGSFLMDSSSSSPERSHHHNQRISELPAGERPVRRSMLLNPESPPQQRWTHTLERPTDTKWTNDDAV